MPRQLKSYVTSNGFFDLAVAAPSMKAAIEIWGAGPDLFQRGYASTTSDPLIVKATMARPGVVLKRGVGARGAFREDAEVPNVSTLKKSTKRASALTLQTPGKSAPVKPKKANPAADKRAAKLYALAQARRHREKARVEILETKARERHRRAIEKVEAAYKKALEVHERRMSELKEKRAWLERGARREDERWREEKRGLEAAIREVKSQA